MYLFFNTWTKPLSSIYTEKLTTMDGKSNAEFTRKMKGTYLISSEGRAGDRQVGEGGEGGEGGDGRRERRGRRQAGDSRRSTKMETKMEAAMIYF